MKDKLVIVRASQGEPLARTVISEKSNLVYLANPARIDAVRAGETYPVGFPCEDVFQFDDRLAALLEEQWRTTGRTEERGMETVCTLSCTCYLGRRFALTKLLSTTANPMAGISAPGGRS